MRERVLAIDPGKLTGIAYLERVENVVTLHWSMEAPPWGTVPAVRELAEAWRPRDAGDAPLRVVMESFLITVETGKKSQEASWALRTQGSVEQLLADSGYPERALRMQAPAVKKVFPNPRLKKLGLWHVGGQGHALDGIRHGLVYLLGTGIIRENSAVTGGEDPEPV